MKNGLGFDKIYELKIIVYTYSDFNFNTTISPSKKNIFFNYII
jgi:hypothetical protein